MFGRVVKNDTNYSTIKYVKSQVQIAQKTETAYPPLLREIHDPPAQLYVLGSLEFTGQPIVAVVGSRKATPYGLEAVKRLISPLAEAGVLIVSGLAHGIDGAAHRAALAGGGQTVAVLGTAIDVIYPTAHHQLAQQIEQGRGAIISESGPGTRVHRGAFPLRNRIIAGMSHATIVIEAALESGSLITARCALEENREVFVVPGPITSPTAAGTNNLLKLGARPVTEPNDVLELFGRRFTPQQTRLPLLADADRQVVDLLSPTDPLHIDKILESVTIDLPQLQSQLTLLEIRGVIRMVAPGRYIRI